MAFIDDLRAILSAMPQTAEQLADALYDMGYSTTRHGCYRETVRWLNAMLKVGEVLKTGRGSSAHPYVWEMRVKE